MKDRGVSPTKLVWATLAGSGPGLGFEPDQATRLTDGFTVGSDLNGLGQAGGVFDELATFNCPLDQAEVTTNYPYPAILTQPQGQTVAAADRAFFPRDGGLERQRAADGHERDGAVGVSGGVSGCGGTEQQRRIFRQPRARQQAVSAAMARIGVLAGGGNSPGGGAPADPVQPPPGLTSGRTLGVLWIAICQNRPVSRRFLPRMADGADAGNAKCKMQNEAPSSAKAAKSAVQILWLRLCRAGIFRVVLG